MTHTRETRAHAAEVKFLVSAAVGEQIGAWARANLEADPHGGGPFGDEYHTTTIYLDTPTLDVFQRRGSFGRAKYRIRRYAQSDTVFLERKLRKPGMLVKRRSQVSMREFERLEQHDVSGNWPGHWFERRLAARGVGPVCQLSYHRIARSLPGGDFTSRLTLDNQLHAFATDAWHFRQEPGTGFLDGHVILELKFRGQPPAAFVRLMDQFGLVPQSISKYRLGLAAAGHPLAVPPAADSVPALL